jgi:hypothetical protein
MEKWEQVWISQRLAGQWVGLRDIGWHTLRPYRRSHFASKLVVSKAKKGGNKEELNLYKTHDQNLPC